MSQEQTAAQSLPTEHANLEAVSGEPMQSDATAAGTRQAKNMTPTEHKPAEHPPGETARDPLALHQAKTVTLRAAQRVFILTLGLNLLVSFSKLAWGYHTHTLSLAADGFHSLLDAVANVVGIIGLNYSMKPADHDHPYGHRKFEAIASMIISFFIFLTCFEIAGSGFERITSHSAAQPHVSIWSYVIIAITLGINLFVAWYENKEGQRLKNELLLTDAKHTMSDCMVSVSVIVSMVAVQLGFAWADTVIAFIVAALILKVGFDLIMVHMSALLDEAVLDPAEIRRIVLSVPGVRDCHKIRSRGMQDHVFVDLHIQVDPAMSVKEAHQISYHVESALEQAFDYRVNEVLVHIEEYEG